VHEEARSLKAFAKRNKRLFRGAYKPERITITYAEAAQKLAALPSGDVRRTAERMLFGAQRWSDKACGDGLVVGKGGRVRQEYSPADVQGATAPYQKVYRALKAVGLKPHTLRTLALNRLVERGATAADLMEVAGWSSMSTAVAYLQPKEHKRLKEMLAAPAEGTRL
jgi:integrase